MTYFGWPSLCLRVADLEDSRRFYTHFGMRVIDQVAEKRAVLQYGAFNLSLMTFLDANLLNFRGGDVFAAYTRLKSVFPDLTGEPERYTPEKYDAAASGQCWETTDPDGNVIFLDTNETESGDAYIRMRSVQVLRNAEQELEALGAAPELLDAFRTQILDRFAGGDQ